MFYYFMGYLEYRNDIVLKVIKSPYYNFGTDKTYVSLHYAL